MSETPKTRAEVVGLWAETLAATEAGLGSILHGLQVPLAGTMLSLNQAAFLARATRSQIHQTAARTLPMEFSSITAILKLFSHVGKKLTPMLTITTDLTRDSASKTALRSAVTRFTSLQNNTPTKNHNLLSKVYR